jgi:hypothetical protein
MTRNNPPLQTTGFLLFEVADFPIELFHMNARPNADSGIDGYDSTIFTTWGVAATLAQAKQANGAAQGA